MNIKDLLGDAYKEGMTLEEIETALADVTMPVDRTAEYERLKSALSKSNSEAADYKRQLRAKLSEEEQKAQKEAEEKAEMERKYNELLRETQAAKYRAEYIALGYDEKFAAETAEAVVKGDIAKVFANQKLHQENIQKKIRAELLRNTPKPTPDGELPPMTLKKLQEMSLSDRMKFASEHADEYKQLYGG